jgi:hypothetical protein
MAITVSGTQITFNDATTQTTAFTGGGQYQFSLALRGSATNSSGSPMVFNSTGSCTWTCPAGVTKIKLVVVGGGGGGAGNYDGGTLGGYGGFGIGFYTVTPGTAYAVTIGAGASGAGAGATGGTGGSSSFGSLLTATGGTGGVREYGQRTNGSASLGNIKNSNAGSAFCDATSGPQYISDGNAGSAQTYTISSQYSAGSAGQNGQVVNQGQGSMSGAVYVEYVGS